MAKGNIGNLLQHFIALRCAEQVVKSWNQPMRNIEYIDLYTMAPWENITSGQPQGFVRVVDSFIDKAARGDTVARAFQSAW